MVAPGDTAEYRRVGHAIAAEAVGAVHPARILAGDKQPRQLGAAIGREFDAAHQVVRGRHDFDFARREVEPAVGAAFDHALELAAHVLRPEMGHGKVHAALAASCARRASRRRSPATTMSRVARSARASTSTMKRRPAPSKQVTTGAAQALFEHRPGHARVRPGQQPGRMKLHHFHVAQRQTRRRAPAPGRRSSCHRKACGSGTSSGRRRWPATPRGLGRGRIRRCARR